MTRRASAGIPPGHRPYRLPPGEPVRWPEAFGRRFTIFCDVEEEFDWSAPLDRAQRSTEAMQAFPDAHARFAGLGVGLTCMVDHPIATDARATAMLAGAAADKRSAIGAQLHAWVTPPFGEPATPFASFAGNLPRAAERAKIAALTEAITAAFRTRPLAFRAGRYGLGPHTLPLLAEAGYRLDSSVRPGHDYGAEGGPDFSRSDNAAHRRDGLIELPLTTLFTGRGGAGLYRRVARSRLGRGLAARTGLAARVSLTPEGMPIADVLTALDMAAAAERLLVFSFHSPSLAPGHTPYVRDTAELRTFWRWWDAVLARLDRCGFQHASLAEILDAAG